MKVQFWIPAGPAVPRYVGVGSALACQWMCCQHYPETMLDVNTLA